MNAHPTFGRLASALVLSLVAAPSFGQCSDDSFEPNDVCQAATLTSIGLHTDLTVNATDDDWYRIVVPSGRMLEVFVYGIGLDLTLFDTSCVGAIVSQGSSYVSATHEGSGNKTYYLRAVVTTAQPCVDYEIELRLLSGFQNFCRGNGGESPGCTDCPCNNNASTLNGGCTNGSGTSAILAPAGFSSVTNPTLNFRLFDGNPDTFAVLLSGDRRAPGNPANPCFGTGSGIVVSTFDGLRCVIGDVRRHGTRPTDAGGDVGLTNNRWGPPNGPVGGLISQGGFVSGQSRFYQVVYREDPALSCGTGLNTSQGVHVIIFP